MLTLVALVAGALVAYVVWAWVLLERNVRRASRMGIPTVRLLFDPYNVFWLVFEANLWKITDALPFPWLSYPEPLRYARRGWHFFEKAETHTRHGPIWALVSGASTNVLVSDPDAVRDILTRRRDFVRVVKNYKVLDVFGPSISTADVNNWSRHRKAVAAPFNENVMKFVWSEAIKQTTAVIKAWSRPDVRTAGIASVQDDMRSVSLNVLAASGFRKSHDFQDSQTLKEETSYRVALQTILDNAILLMLIPYKVLMAPMVPKTWAKIGRAGDSFKRHMVQMLDEETQALKQGKPGAGGIMTSLVKALEVFEKDPSGADSSLAKGLSVEEIFGNIFVINFAGHDTTANTLTFAMMLLAREPDLQDWVAEEISQVTQDMDPEEWTYDRLFERLLRCRAILYETLRVFPPVLAVPRATPVDRSEVLEVQGRSITIPPDTSVTVMLLACQTNPAVWSDPLEWKPRRWITQEGTFYQPKPWTFFPWSDGPQNCPGKKFAEVEFVAILAVLFQKHRLQVKRGEGESVAAASDRVMATVHDCNMEMLLRMTDADRVRLQCT